MLSTPGNRQFPSFHRRVFSSNLEDHSLDHRAYRSLLSYFSDNLNSLAKQQLSCLNDLEELPKIRVTSEESKCLESGLQDVYLKHQSRLSKEMLFRNSAIRKAYQDFIEEYEPMGPDLRNEENRRKGFSSYKTPSKDGIKSILFPMKKDGSHTRYAGKNRKFSFNNEGSIQLVSQRRRVNKNNTTNFICKVSQFKTFDSEQVLISSAVSVDRVKTTYDRQTVASRVRRGSCHVKTTQEVQNKELSGLFGESMVIAEAFHVQQQDWEIQQNKLSDIKHAKTFYTPRVLAIRNRLPNPESILPKVDLLKKTKNHWISAVQPQGYKARSKEISQVLTVK